MCFEIEESKEDLSEYSFIVLRGTLEVVSAQHERVEALEKLAEERRTKLSPNFLPAYGFNKEDGWSSLTLDETPLVVIELENITQELVKNLHDYIASARITNT